MIVVIPATSIKKTDEYHARKFGVKEKLLFTLVRTLIINGPKNSPSDFFA